MGGGDHNSDYYSSSGGDHNSDYYSSSGGDYNSASGGDYDYFAWAQKHSGQMKNETIHDIVLDSTKVNSTKVDLAKVHTLTPYVVILSMICWLLVFAEVKVVL